MERRRRRSAYIQRCSVWGIKNLTKDGRADNPKPEVVVITEYVYDNKRIARFDPRVPDVFLLIDMEESTIARIPYNVPLEKQVLAKPDTDAKENREG